ncbi:MAG: ATP-dependent RNA helicase HrpA [Actinomycetia bacterium]|nr:ATP-dependent RNA helicase HrpA [Actinomycetes bacterium]
MTSTPVITYPPELPISDRRDDLLATIEANQVVIVAGETGSGKSTQLPKMCLELGRGTDQLIGHTQPRRLAARAIAERLAEEMETTVGQTVGFTVRFNDRVGPETRVKLMTDGILLAEIPRDRSLQRYDTIIIDEAHERSLNIDFILGYLRQLLPHRPDLKVIITSATIDTERFSRHFDNAPVIEVSGRTFPVDIRYQPIDGLDGADPIDPNDAIASAVDQLWRHDSGDILVFCSGEREIRDAAEAVGDLKLPGSEVLPLFARLTAAEQHRVFQPHTKRRVVIATNVAETSVTVPGIRSVIDVGTARISRYSHRTKVQRLPIEDISQASANQRAGRCGRIGPGVCIRLYGEDQFNARPEFTEPEIQRTNLASVILSMAALRLGLIEAFPFIDPPDIRSIRDGIALLTELDALDPERVNTRKWLTPIGRQLAKLPVDPRYGRMLIEADENGCLDEVMIIVAGLSVQDPRERPKEKQQQAADFHRRFADEESDFISYLSLWDHLSIARKERSRNQFRRMCRREFLNYNRVVEWQDIHAQLRQVTRELRFNHAERSRRRRSPNTERTLDASRRAAIHRSILAGLLSHVGLKVNREEKQDRRDKARKPKGGSSRSEFQGARNSRFVVAPGSALTTNAPSWIMAAELVETNRLWARIAAGVEVSWIEELAAHQATYSYGDPWWDEERGTAMVTERVTLYGLTLVANRRIQLASVDPRLARELFIHHALVNGQWSAEHRFVATNRQVFEDIKVMEARNRRRDLLIETKAVFDFYDKGLPADIVGTTHFDTWWATESRTNPNLLDLSVEMLLGPEADIDNADAFPDSWLHGDLDLELAYEFDPTSTLDGASVLVPVELLNQLEQAPFTWSVPGFRSELIGALIRTMPKAQRRLFVPAAETVTAVEPKLDPTAGSIQQVLANHLGRRAGVVIDPDSFDLGRVPQHLVPTFRVINADYELLAEGKDLAVLRRQLHQQVRSTLSSIVAADQQWERTGMTNWEVDSIPRVIDTGEVKAYPSLVDEGNSVAIRLHPTPAEQVDAHWLGTRRLLRLNVAGPARQLDELLSGATKLSLVNGHVQSKAEWYQDAIDASFDQVIADGGGPPWTRGDFDVLLDQARAQLPDRLAMVGDAIGRLVVVLDGIHTKSDRLTGSNYQVSLDDISAHLGRLAYPGFLAGVGLHRVDDVIRYLGAIDRRLDGLVKSPTRDLEALAICRRLDNELAEVASLRPESERIEDVIWMLEELRVSLFAQSLGTKGKISEKRVRRALNEVRSSPSHNP